MRTVSGSIGPYVAAQFSREDWLRFERNGLIVAIHLRFEKIKGCVSVYRIYVGVCFDWEVYVYIERGLSI